MYAKRAVFRLVLRLPASKRKTTTASWRWILKKRDNSIPFSSQMRQDLFQSHEATPAPSWICYRPLSRDASPVTHDLDGCEGVQNGLRALESKVNRANHASAGSVSDLARIGEAIAAVSRRLDLVTTSFLCDDDGVPITNLFCTQGDIHALHGLVQIALNGADEGVTEQLRPITSDVHALTTRVTKLEADIAAKTAELLVVRENVARTTLNTASILTRTSNASPATVSTPSANAFEFAVIKIQVKRKASVELVSAPKRTAGKPEKGSFSHWCTLDWSLRRGTGAGLLQEAARGLSWRSGRAELSLCVR
ncbi:hypothetical protein B0H10DRAFT_932777 [Mycena sp. CBHHK59/15]|nr:hypothetical protein B0H10DRAFT_932777 [Mycena sp. CBHHK59/15]